MMITKKNRSPLFYEMIAIIVLAMITCYVLIILVQHLLVYVSSSNSASAANDYLMH